MSFREPKPPCDRNELTSVDESKTISLDFPTPPAASFFEMASYVDAFTANTEGAAFAEDNLPFAFGDYTLEEVVGQGGAGVVFKATPGPDSVAAKNFDVVAVKLIRPEILASPKAVQRFEKESRVHAEIDSDFVTRHLEFGSQGGVYYIASEFVEGVSLNDVIEQLQTLSVKQVLRVVSHILNALDALHQKDIVHRDVKPSNVIVNFSSPTENQAPSFDEFVIAKLTDFGLARHIEQSDSLAITRQQTLLGTPLYMSPEQYLESRSVDARADIYSVGVTLYEMLNGQPPFRADEASELAEMHRIECPIALTSTRQGITEAINNIVMKALEKEPDQRYQTAAEMLADVERVLNDQPIGLRLYPETPDTFDPSVRCYDFQWELAATTKQLWPLVSDTDRFNQAIGLPAPKFTYEHTDGHRKMFAQVNFKGMKMRWREHPFQWIFQREMSVLREFESGPFKWVTSTVKLQPLAGNRTRLMHCFQVKPRGILGKVMTPIQFSFLTKRSLDQTYLRLAELANDTSCNFACDVPFDKPIRLSKRQRKSLDERVEQMAAVINDPTLVREFSRLLGSVADAFAARIRPIVLSRKMKCSTAAAIELCLRGVEVGILNMSWDVICPVCRIAAGNASSLTRLQEHANCEVCDLDFEVDAFKSVEVVFSVHSEIRPIQRKTYCIGGPYHAPHVLAQNRLLANQFVDVGVRLATGKYQICGPQLPQQPYVNVFDDALSSRVEFEIGSQSSSLPDLKTGPTCIHIENQSQAEVVVRLEQTADRKESLTAAVAIQDPLFQKLFPQEVVDHRALVDLSNVYLLNVKLLDSEKLIDDLGEVRLRECLLLLQRQFQTVANDCRLVQCNHDSMLFSFSAVSGVVEALNSFLSANSASDIPSDACCFCINFGEVMIDMQENHPSAFGKTVRETGRMLADVSQCCIILPVEIFNKLTVGESEHESDPFLGFTTMSFDAVGDAGELIQLLPRTE